jgi:CRP/FNR family transcriptional regulator
MELSEYLPFWNRLTGGQQEKLKQAAVLRKAGQGAQLNRGSGECLGLLVVRSGQLRIYLSSPEGREVTLYRLFARDMCLMSASCVMNNIQFDVSIEAEKDTEMWMIRPEIYRELMDESAAVANYSNELMSSRFSEVMWLVEQIMWNSFDRRLAGFLLEESALEEDRILRITHEKIANHLGTAREVVTRMLRYFQNEGMVKLGRGTIEIAEPEKLEKLLEE